MALNCVIMNGRIASDLELKQTRDGESFCSFSIAVQKNKDHTDFFRCSAYRQTAEFINRYFAKGDGIGVTGSMDTSTAEKNGTTITYYTINIERAFFTEGKKRDASGENQASPSNDQFEDVDPDDDMPF